MKYIHPQAVYQWKYVDFSVKQVWFELKRMGFAAVVHTEVLVKKQLGHWDQENTLPIFACVRAITLPSPREIGMKNWMNVCIDNSSWYFFPSTFQIALFLLPHIYCSLCCASKTQCLSLGEFTALCSLFCILILRDYYEIITFCMWVGTLKYVSCRWTDGVLASPKPVCHHSSRDLLHSHLWGAYAVLCIIKCSSGLIFVPAWAWGTVGLKSISIAVLLSLWQGAAWGSSCCWGAWVGWDTAGAHEISLPQAMGTDLHSSQDQGNTKPSQVFIHIHPHSAERHKTIWRSLWSPAFGSLKFWFSWQTLSLQCDATSLV